MKGVQPKVSAMYVVKDEEEYLPFSIKSIYPVVDEIIVVDNGSTDSTIDIVKACDKAKLYFSSSKDFSELRNLALEKAGGDWLIKIDADEVFYEEIQEILPDLLNDVEADGFSCWFYHLIKDYFHMQNEVDQDARYRRVFMVRNNPNLRWVNAVHEELLGVGDNIKQTDLFYVHYGYVKPQWEVFKRWQLYARLEGKEGFYQGVNPDSILDDRPLQPFDKIHPSAIWEYVKQKGGNSLEVGAGENPSPGFEHLDIRKLPHIEYVADFGNIPLENNSCRRLVAANVLQCVSFNRVLEVLSEWFRVTRPGGKLWVRVPNIHWLAWAYTNYQIDIYQFIKLVYDGEDCIENCQHSAFDPALLQELLSQEGFINVHLTWKETWGFEVEAQKPYREGNE